jgi:hypothetical protein
MPQTHHYTKDTVIRDDNAAAQLHHARHADAPAEVHEPHHEEAAPLHDELHDNMLDQAMLQEARLVESHEYGSVAPPHRLLILPAYTLLPFLRSPLGRQMVNPVVAAGFGVLRVGCF